MDYKELIKKLREQNQSLTAYNDLELAHCLEDAATAIETLLAERDAAVEDLTLCASCATCKYNEVSASDSPCAKCRKIKYKENLNWEWRGSQTQGIE